MKTLMTHLYYGDPHEGFSFKLAQTLTSSGADILEIGIPYTDPVCDGEIFQRASRRSLEHSTTPVEVLKGIRKIKDKRYGDSENNIPIYLTSYYGPIFKMGEGKFVEKAKDAGVKGLIVPDLLLEEQTELRKACDLYGLSLIQFATVYSSGARLREICEASTDFIYCIALPGVTGENQTSSRLPRLLKSLKSYTNLKIMVGFGLKTPADASDILRMGADGIIVGSAIARIYEKCIDLPEKSLSEISKFIKGIKESMI